MSRKCNNEPNSFCYVCGDVVLKSDRRNITPQIEYAYEHYFGCKLGDQDKNWAPHICCQRCAATLLAWIRGEKRSLPFTVPMIWREPNDHATDCYFCLCNISGFNRKWKRKITYPNVPSAIRPVALELPVPEPPQNKTHTREITPEEQTETNSVEIESYDIDYATSSKEPHFLTQSDMNDLVRDLHLSKEQAELLASRLQGWNLLDKSTKITCFRTRQRNFQQFFHMHEDLCVCINIDGLIDMLGFRHDPEEWRLFIDSSKYSLKAVLLHIGNIHPSIPVAYSTNMKESYENLKIVLRRIQYEKYNWNVCGDLKVIALLLGLQLGYTKYCCFLCEWDSRAREDHYIRKDWPPRQQLVPGEKNVKHRNLIDAKKIYLPPLHIKLEIMKNFVKAMDKSGPGFAYLKTKFPSISDAKIKEGIFVGPQIRKLMQDECFTEKLNDMEKAVWLSLIQTTQCFLGKQKSKNYVKIVKKLLENCKRLGCNMSLKLHFLHSHLDFFPPNLADVSDEHGERFHQDISTMEKRYQGKNITAMLADYCWTLGCDTEDATYKRQAKRKHF